MLLSNLLAISNLFLFFFFPLKISQELSAEGTLEGPVEIKALYFI